MFLSNVVYQITCPGCQSSYVGQTTRHLTTRIQEHARPASHVGSHLRNCSQTMQDADVNIIDRTNSNTKLLTLEALHISRRAPSINQKEEYRTRELTEGVICHCSDKLFGLIICVSIPSVSTFFHLMVFLFLKVPTTFASVYFLDSDDGPQDRKRLSKLFDINLLFPDCRLRLRSKKPKGGPFAIT